MTSFLFLLRSIRPFNFHCFWRLLHQVLQDFSHATLSSLAWLQLWNLKRYILVTPKLILHVDFFFFSFFSFNILTWARWIWFINLSQVCIFFFFSENAAHLGSRTWLTISLKCAKRLFFFFFFFFSKNANLDSGIWFIHLFEVCIANTKSRVWKSNNWKYFTNINLYLLNGWGHFSYLVF